MRPKNSKIVDIRQKTRGLYWQVDTPITKDESDYEVSVQIEDKIYIGEYAPRQSGDTLAEEWNVPQLKFGSRAQLGQSYNS
jgi:hypothetical protein